MMCFLEKKVIKGFYHCFMEFGTEGVWTELWMIWCKISIAKYGCRNPNCELRDVFMLWMITVLLVASHSWMESWETRRTFNGIWLVSLFSERFVVWDSFLSEIIQMSSVFFPMQAGGGWKWSGWKWWIRGRGEFAPLRRASFSRVFKSNYHLKMTKAGLTIKSHY